jgi:tetratricopeptide (TPR) repeat protein
VIQLAINLSHDAQALLMQAARRSGGTVGARHLWDSLATVAEREWIRLVGAPGLPEFTDAAEAASIEIGGVRTDRSAGVAMELAAFLADHYASGRVEVGHVAIALAGIRTAGGSAAGMAAAADAFLCAELADLEEVMQAYLNQASPVEPEPIRKPPSGRLDPRAWRLRRAWTRAMLEVLAAAEAGDRDQILARADELLSSAAEIGVKASDVVLLCEASANAAIDQGEWNLADRCAARGMTEIGRLDEPLRSIKQASLCVLRAAAAVQTHNIAAADELVDQARAALASAATSDVQVLAIGQRALDEMADEVSLRLATCLLLLGRIDMAIDTLAVTIGKTEIRRSYGKMLVGLAMAASLFVQIGDIERAAALVAHIDDQFEDTNIAGLSPVAMIAFATMVGYAGAACAMNAGNPDGAREYLIRAIKLIEAAPDGAHQRGGLISLYAKLVEHYLDAGQRSAATELLRRLKPGEIIRQTANTDILEVAVRWADLVMPGATKALVLVKAFEHYHGRDALPPDSVVRVLPSAAADAAASGELAAALDYIGRAAAAMSALSGGRLPAWRRSTLFASQERSRDTCLEVAAIASEADADRAGTLALQIAEVWRESTLASLLIQRPSDMSDALREMFDEIEKLTAMLGDLEPVATTSSAMRRIKRSQVTA